MKTHLLATAGPLILACCMATTALAEGDAPTPAAPAAATVPVPADSALPKAAEPSTAPTTPSPPAATAASADAAPPKAAPAKPATTQECPAKAMPVGGTAFPAVGAQAKAQSALALQLLAARAADGYKTQSISPSGIAAVLGALDLGANPALRAALVKTLQLQGRDGGKSADASARMEDLRRALRLLAAGPADTSLSSANALFVDLKQPLKPGIAERFVAEAQMPVRAVDLASAKGIGEVNAFVSDSTKGRIPTILNENDTGAALVAVNAFHFLGCWQVPFDPQQTRPARFNRLDGKPIEVPTMVLEDASLSHKVEGRFAAVDLSYNDPRYSLVLVTTTDKPAKAGEFGTAGKLLEGTGFTVSPIGLELPRFRIESSAELLPQLSKLGLEAGLKTPDALSGIADGIRLSAVRQKAFIAVDERGTEAAAATAAVATRSAAARPPSISFDKPFVFALRHKPTGMILLSGYVAEPTAP